VEFRQEPTPTEEDRYGKSLQYSFFGAMFGCIAVGIVSGAMGVWPLFFAYLPLTVHLALSALLGAALTNLLPRLSRRPPSPRLLVVAAATLTFLIFAALPLYLFFNRAVWPAELLFG